MTYVQALPLNPHVSCIPGFCEMYVQDAFGIKPKYASAKADWNANTFNHKDTNFPKGVAVPVWFSGKGNTGDLAMYGHVALLMPDGSVYSASEPGSTTPKHFSTISSLESYYGGELNYLGWSEDVEDTLVIKEVNMADKISLDTARILAFEVLGRNGVYNKENALNGDSDADLKKYHVGRDLTNAYLYTLYSSKEAQDFKNSKPASGNFVPITETLFKKA